MEHPSTSFTFICTNEISASGAATTAYLDPPDEVQVSNLEGIWISSWIPSYALEILLPQLKRKGVGVVILIPATPQDFQPLSEFGLSTLELARKLGMNVVALHEPHATVAVAAALSRFMGSDLWARSINMTAFTQAVHQMEPSPEVVVSELKKYVNARIAVINSLGLPLAGALERPPEFGSIGVSALFDPNQTPSLISVPSPPLMEDDDPALWILAEFQPDAPSFELEAAKELMELGALSLLRWLSRQRFASEQFQSARSAIVSQLAVAGGAIPDHVVSQALSVGWNLNGWHTLISVRAPRKSLAHDVGRMLPAALARYDYRVDSSEYIDHWLIWETRQDQPTRGDYRDFVAALDSLRPPPETGIVFGVARPRLGPEGFARSIAEAEEFARQASSSKGRRQIVDAQESVATQLIRTTLHDPSLVRPATKFLKRLSEPDADYLRKTLATYLQSESNLTETARALEVHRNTVVKRIEKIEELLDSPLENPDTKFALRIALRILEISSIE
ncbi:PucR family transcriptional regulator [Arthrobacter bambusae]|uniref:PucR family transcriptional regulator n=1 Tax=Arthrobacter bambusae TaxID=1338426 RepID=UPI00277F423D|nr:helix-turn-helix domain-containing protein [Arthrobacter bambusae]MDQ0028508.1 hypothetical protein [Arthrobacter bambusae]MDQ0096698.1 hypothetical protein [Arthrobacter bambusae]